MRWVAFLISACGGLVEPVPDAGQDAANLHQTDLRAGPCEISVSFMDRGGPWQMVTTINGLATSPSGERPAVLCAGVDDRPSSSGFHYALELEPLVAAAGARAADATLRINKNGRGINAAGTCTVEVSSFSTRSVSASFDCPKLEIAYGVYAMRGTFTVPLP